MAIVKRILTLIVNLFFVFLVFGQDNSARLMVLQGSEIAFNFNRISNYQNGIVIENGTIFGISFGDGPSATNPTGWHIDFGPNGSSTIDGEDASNLLPLETIEVRAQNESGLGIGTTTYNQATQTDYQFLTNADVRLVESTQVPCVATTDQINIDYRCGVTNGSMLGEVSDYYSVEIEFILIPDF